MHFERLTLLGQGAMGQVWRARHPPTGTLVAIKWVGDVGLSEVRAAAALDHPGIVTVHDTGQDDQGTWLAMELADGDLGSSLPTSWSQLRALLVALLDALAHAHARGVVHLDLKPGNVLRVGDLWKLADFGIAHRVGDVGVDKARGTPWYMSPEQYRGDWRAYGPWTDLYALGCMAWHLAARRPPFRGDFEVLSRSHRYDPPGELLPSFPVPPGFETWLRRLLAKSPQERYRRAADAGVALLALPDATGEGAPAVTLQPTLTSLGTLTGVFVPAPEATPSASAVQDVPELPERWQDRASAEALRGTGLGLFGLRQVPLVGRETLQSTLWDALSAVHTDRSARIVLLGGEAGAGKSRLAEWLCTRAHEVGGAIVLQARSREDLGPMIARALGVAALDPSATTRALARRLEGEGISDPFESKGLAGLIHPDATEVELGSARVRNTLVERMIRRLAQERPVVLWVDDIPDNPDALSLFRHLDGRDVPVLLLATARDAADPVDLPGRIVVPALGADAHRKLVDVLLDVDAALAHSISRRTDGNPLFLVALVGDLVARGVLVVGPRGYRLADGATAELPDHVAEAWRSRAHQLLAGRPAQDAVVVELAAITEDPAEWDAACAVAGVRRPDDLVDAMVSARLLRPLPDGWAWAHPLIRESLDTGDAVLHGHVAAALAGRTDRVGQDRRVRHQLAAGIDPGSDLPDAAGYRIDRGHYREAEWLLAQAPQTPEADAMRALLCRKTDDLDEGRRYALRALDTLQEADPDLAVELRIFLGSIAWAAGDLDEAERYLERAVREVDAHGLRRRALACASTCCNVLVARGKLQEAVERIEWALAQALPNMPVSRSDLYRMRGVALMNMGRLDEAEEAVLLALDFARKGGAATHEAYALSDLGEVQRLRGDLDAAADSLEQSADRFRAVGSAGILVPTINRALILLTRERWPDARLAMHDVLAMTSRRQVVGLATLGLAVCDLAQNEPWRPHFDEARGYLEGSTLLDAAMMAEQMWHIGEVEDARTWAESQYRVLSRDADAARLAR